MTRQQKFASKAHAAVQNVRGSGSLSAEAKRFAKEYKARAENFPVMVLQSGLLQAIGFLRAKGEGKGKPAEAYKAYLKDLVSLLSDITPKDYHEGLIKQTDLTRYRIQTRECLTAAGWIKRFAQTLLSEDLLDPKSESSNQREVSNG
ncbi:type III-B CRISPR module-associated protein Cmr5 [Ahniella affigens]|uniref:CRISPR type III-B/RAMP module-associated protein Cmr5 n=1 Tax=Ahniella affigens TaxID=2021234 RepID=A0A2P1PTS7_9GAMM|nr:type III-B CRISPR module-associated protein Cmr5 [Ahniella affigens]AVP98230.1 type III-B CRISPR module-associated protein Cmr5 [Ahniella affigens]